METENNTEVVKTVLRGRADENTCWMWRDRLHRLTTFHLDDFLHRKTGQNWKIYVKKSRSDKQRKKLTERFVLIELSESLFYLSTQPLEQTFDFKIPAFWHDIWWKPLVLMCCWRFWGSNFGNFVCWRPHNFNLVVLVIWVVTSAVTCPLFSPSEP